MIGIPYARINEDGTRTCPTCQAVVHADETDAHGEALTNNYGEHYAQEHEESPPASQAHQVGS